MALTGSAYLNEKNPQSPNGTNTNVGRWFLRIDAHFQWTLRHLSDVTATNFSLEKCERDADKQERLQHLAFFSLGILVLWTGIAYSY